jgi:hypothetical protein
MNPLKTCFAPDYLARYWSSELSPAESEGVERHLAECSVCLEQVRALETRDPFCRTVESACAPSAPGPLPELDAGKFGQRFVALASKDTPSSGTPSADKTSTFGNAPESALPSLDFLSPPQQAGELGRLGHYRILEILGKGGMGIVFRAEEISLRRDVALKVMLPELAGDPHAKERFLREARSAATVVRDQIVPIYFVGDDRGVPFLAMQLLQGETLEERLRRDEKLPVPEVIRIGREISEGLAAAHECGLIHRDVKPANIWLEKGTGRVKLLDFGLARSIDEDSHLTSARVVLGTPAYMAPEQVEGDKVDFRCDLFSLGCVLYRMSTGQAPFKGEKPLSILRSLAVDQPLPPKALNSELPQAFSELVTRLLAKDPQDRPPSAMAVAEALKAIHPVRATRPRWLIAATLLGLAVFVLAGIVLFWETRQGTVRIEINDPQIKVAFDKEDIIIQGLDKHDIVLRPGDHVLRIKRGDFEFTTDKFILRKGETITLKVELIPGKLQVFRDGKLIDMKELPLATPLAPDRQAAEWVLQQGGRVTVVDQDEVRYDDVTEIGKLPEGPFRLVKVTHLNRAPEPALKKGLAQLPKVPALRHLDFCECPVKNEDFVFLKDLVDLEYLSLQRTAITGDGLPPLKKLVKLRELNLGDLPIKDDALKHLAAFSRLEHLNVACSDMTGSGLVHLQNQKELRYLGLAGTPLKADELKNLELFPALEGLDLSWAPHLGGNGPIDDEFLNTLVQTLKKLPKLTKLGLKYTKISDDSIAQLWALKGLKYLELAETKITSHGVERLRKEMPGCTIGLGK